METTLEELDELLSFGRKALVAEAAAEGCGAENAAPGYARDAEAADAEAPRPPGDAGSQPDPPLHGSINLVPVAQLPGRHFVDEKEGLAIARDFFLTGNLSEIARTRGIRYDTLLDLARQGWFQEEVRNLNREAAAQLKVRLTRILGRSLDELEDRLEHGDHVWRDKRLRIVPIKGSELATIAATVFAQKLAIEQSETGFGSAEGKRLLDLANALRASAARPIMETLDGDEIIRRAA